MGPLPDGRRRVPLAIEIVETVDEPTYLRKKNHLRRRAGRPPSGVAAADPESRGSRAKAPAMLCLHQTVKIGKDEPAGLGPKSDLAYAKKLAERLYRDCPRLSQFRKLPRQPICPRLRSSVDEGDLESHGGRRRAGGPPEVDPGRIGAIGHSLGGNNADLHRPCSTSGSRWSSPRAASTTSRTTTARSPAGRPRDTCRRLLSRHHGLPARGPPFDFPELIAALAPRGLFVNAPTRDAEPGVEGVRTCLRGGAGLRGSSTIRKRLRAVHPAAEHAFPEAARAAAYRFIDERLKP